MKQLFIALLFVATGLSLAHAQDANDYDCKWAFEAANADPAGGARQADPTGLSNSSRPLVIAASACSKNGAVTAGGATTNESKPLCVGRGYCTSKAGNEPPQYATFYCQAVEFNGQWRCPQAQACAADPTTTAREIAALPRPRSARGSSTGAGSSGNSRPPSGNGQAIDGVGGR